MENLVELCTKCASTARKNLAAERPACSRGFHVARATVRNYYYYCYRDVICSRATSSPPPLPLRRRRRMAVVVVVRGALTTSPREEPKNPSDHVYSCRDARACWSQCHARHYAVCHTSVPPPPPRELRV
ncbi:unnamed protein product [Trichogramma brassicae]|uniref:Uncharacterized protein n=1 Tax=Trichogramma brassicae TaxID=86971 RepID=A0A6H5IPD9_9HYME|nr:unnamed protein product [Trichogramma brassicae]